MESFSAARCLLVSVGLVIAGSAFAQSSDKSPSATPSQGKSAPAKATPAPKSLDFVPSTSAKDTAATRTAAPVSTQPAQAPVKDRSNCHSSASDA